MYVGSKTNLLGNKPLVVILATELTTIEFEQQIGRHNWIVFNRSCSPSITFRLIPLHRLVLFSLGKIIINNPTNLRSCTFSSSNEFERYIG